MQIHRPRPLQVLAQPSPVHTSAVAPERMGILGWLVAASVWVVLVLMELPGGFDMSDRLVPDPGMMRGGFFEDTVILGEANPFTRTIWLVLFGISLLVIGLRFGTLRNLMRFVNKPMLVFMALAFASILWSIDPDASIRRLTRLVMVTSLATAAVLVAWQPGKLQRLFRWACGVFVIGSIALVQLAPQYGVHMDTWLFGAWRGLSGSKNGLGLVCAVSTLLWLHAALTRDGNRLLAFAFAGLSFFVLAMSRSSTSMMATVFSAAVMVLMLFSPPAIKRYLPILIGSLTALILIYSLAVLNLIPGTSVLLKPITLITGKDMSFTGRTEIWQPIIEHIRMRPLLGSGYGGFWTGNVPGSDAYQITRLMQGFYPGSSHNGYLDIVNDLGTLGLMCLVAYLIVYIRDAIRVYHLDKASGALFITLFMQQALNNLSESQWLWVSSFGYVVITYANMALARSLMDADTAARQAVAMRMSAHAAQARGGRMPVR